MAKKEIIRAAAVLAGLAGIVAACSEDEKSAENPLFKIVKKSDLSSAFDTALKHDLGKYDKNEKYNAMIKEFLEIDNCDNENNYQEFDCGIKRIEKLAFLLQKYWSLKESEFHKQIAWEGYNNSSYLQGMIQATFQNCLNIPIGGVYFLPELEDCDDVKSPRERMDCMLKNNERTKRGCYKHTVAMVKMGAADKLRKRMYDQREYIRTVKGFFKSRRN